MELWTFLFDILALLLVALIFGAICERLRQSAILGYLLAGTLLGPNALHVISTGREVEGLAELGVALLLFSIGLEFSWKRLRSMGTVALGGGTLQIVVTLGAAAALSRLSGLDLRAAVAVGAVLSLSSTACVLRILTARTEMESVHGRLSLGILLLQDLAVVPLVLVVSVLSGRGESEGIFLSLGKLVAGGAGLLVLFYLLFNQVVPRVIRTRALLRNRELPILLALVVGLGAAWIAHRFGFSPAIGAFLAGMLLAESPFAVQLRADIASLRTVLLTLFFSSIGMLADFVWISAHWAGVILLCAGVLVGKTAIVWGVLRLFHQPHRSALAAGICLAQVGEFSFVFASEARGELFGETLFQYLVSAMMITLFLTPLLVATAMRMSDAAVRCLERWRLLRPASVTAAAERSPGKDRIIIVGYGPSGQRVGELLEGSGDTVAVVDLNPQLVHSARERGFDGHIGDATSADVLEHLHVDSAAVVVVTVPDPQASRSVIRLVKSRTSRARIISRARYHKYRRTLELAGADVVVDEEETVGERLASELERFTESAPPPD